MDTQSFAHSILSILLVVKLMVSAHPRARQYYHEICRSVYPTMQIQVNNLL